MKSFFVCFLVAIAASAHAMEPEDFQDGRRLAHHQVEDDTRLTSVSGCMITETVDKDLSAEPDALNEPCYVHDAVCNGYPVCCVAIGTCPAMVSSNALYYDGGCASPSATGGLPASCTKQGECNEVYLEYMMGGTTSQYATKHDIPASVTSKFMQGSTGNGCTTKCGDGPVTDAECGTGFSYDPLAADKICAGTTCDVSGSADHSSTTDFANHDHRYCCVGGTCDQVTDEDCGDGYVTKEGTTTPGQAPKWLLTDGPMKCLGPTCDVGSADAADQKTCCQTVATCADANGPAMGGVQVSVTDCGEGYVPNFEAIGAGTNCMGRACDFGDKGETDHATCCTYSGAVSVTASLGVALAAASALVAALL
jgi:hypothetical protein